MREEEHGGGFYRLADTRRTQTASQRNNSSCPHPRPGASGMPDPITVMIHHPKRRRSCQSREEQVPIRREDPRAGARQHVRQYPTKRKKWSRVHV
jgi:hypothetical protein